MKRLIFILFLSFLALDSTSQNNTKQKAKNSTLELSIGLNPNKKISFNAKDLPHTKNYLGMPVKLYFGRILNRRNEIGLSLQFSSYKMFFFNGIQFYNSDDPEAGTEYLDYYFEGIPVPENSDNIIGVFKRVNHLFIAGNYRIYTKGSLAPFGRYVELGFGYSSSSFSKNEDRRVYEPELTDPVENKSFNLDAQFAYLQVGFGMKKVLAKNYYLTVGTNLKLGLQFSDRYNAGRKYLLLDRYNDEQDILQKFFKEQVYWQLRSFEIVTCELKIGKLF